MDLLLSLLLLSFRCPGRVVWRRVLLSFTWCLVESGLTVCFCSGGFGVVLCVDVFRGSPVLVVWRVSGCWSKRVLLRLGFGQRVVYGFGSGLDRVLPSCSPPLMASPSLRVWWFATASFSGLPPSVCASLFRSCSVCRSVPWFSESVHGESSPPRVVIRFG